MMLTVLRRFALAAASALSACGGGGSTPSDGPAPTPNRAPLAHAGSDQSVRAGMPVTLDGRASADPDGDPLRYAWTLAVRPAGSAAFLDGANSAAPSFTADMAGDYVATLVVHDGLSASAAATVKVAAAHANAAPIAKAGTAQSVVIGSTVRLDGRESNDADGDALNYQWTLTSRPQGSAAVLSGAQAAVATFTADVAGAYEATLVVDDGRLASIASTAAVRAAAPTLAVEVSPAMADFGTVPIGSSNVRIISVRNTGNGTLNFRPGSPRTDGGAWSIAGRSCLGTLAPSAACTITVAFQPASAAAYSGSAIFDFEQLEAGTVGAILRGNGDGDITLSASVTPASVDFGWVPVGGVGSRVFTLTNTGNRALSFMPGYPVTDGGAWSLGGRSCLGTLAAGASCTVTVEFRPRSAHSYTGAAYFYFNELPVGQGNPLASVSGQGEGGPVLDATVTPSTFDFGVVPVGMAAARVFTITNTGEGTLTFAAGSPATSGLGWSIGGRSCTGSLPAGASCTVTVTFTPDAAQVYSGVLSVDFNELPAGQPSRLSVLGGIGS